MQLNAHIHSLFIAWLLTLSVYIDHVKLQLHGDPGWIQGEQPADWDELPPVLSVDDQGPLLGQLNPDPSPFASHAVLIHFRALKRVQAQKQGTLRIQTGQCEF